MPRYSYTSTSRTKRQLPLWLAHKTASVEAIQKAYGASELPKEIAGDPKGGFAQGASFLRRLSHKDILSAQEDLGVQFSKLGLIPLFDKGDNDYVVYDFRNKRWKLFNIADNTAFNEGKPAVNRA
jgi:hypothetical protein